MLRAGLRGLAALCACLALGGAVAAGSACGSFATESAGGPGDDGGAADGVADTGHAPDAGDGGEAGPVPATTVTFVLAAPGMKSQRLCWAPGGTFDHLANPEPFPARGVPMPASSYPGIPQGSAAMLADADDLTTTTAQTFDLYLLDAQAVDMVERRHATSEKVLCSNLICQNGTDCIGSANYTKVTGVSSVSPGAPFLMVIEGDATQPKVTAIPLGSADMFGPTTLRVQAAQLSPSLSGAIVSFGLATAPGDAGADAAFQATLTALDDVEPSPPAQVTYDTTETQFAAQGFSVAGSLPDGGTATLFMSLAQSLSLQAPTQDPGTYFTQRSPFVVAVIGDPGAPSPGSDAGIYDGTGLHLLVLPTTNVGGSP